MVGPRGGRHDKPGGARLFRDRDATGRPGVVFQKVDDPTPGKKKVHIDFTAADMEAEVKRLVGLGATEAGRGEFGTEFKWVVLADPDGNAFCVAGQESD
jgi:hypothetical protein